MRYRRSLVLIALLAVLALVGAACGEDEPADGGTDETTEPTTSEPTTGGETTPPEETTPPLPEFTTLEEGVLTVGSCLDYPPFESVEGDQEVGFDVEITEEIASRLGLEVKWVKANFDTIFNAVAAGRFDMVAAAATIREDREDIVDFSMAYYSSRQSLTVNTDLTPEITSVDDLKAGDTIGSQKGSTGLFWARDNLEPLGIVIKTYQASPAAFTDLEAGNITGVLNDEPASIEIVKNRPSLAVVQGIDTGEFYGMAFAPESDALREAANQVFLAMVADGTYATIFEKYFPGQEVQDPTQFQVEVELGR